MPPPADVSDLWGANITVRSVEHPGRLARATCELRAEMQLSSDGSWVLFNRSGYGYFPRHWPDTAAGREEAQAWVAGRKPGSDPVRVVRHTVLELREVLDV